MKTRINSRETARQIKRLKELDRLTGSLLRLLMQCYNVDRDKILQQLRDVSESVNIMARQLKRQADAQEAFEVKCKS